MTIKPLIWKYNESEGGMIVRSKASGDWMAFDRKRKHIGDFPNEDAARNAVQCSFDSFVREWIG